MYLYHHFAICVCYHTQWNRDADTLQYAKLWARYHGFDVAHACTKQELDMALPKSALSRMERKAMQMQWALYRKGGTRYKDDQSVVAVGVGDNKCDMERAFALAGALRLTSFFGQKILVDDDLVYTATRIIL